MDLAEINAVFSVAGIGGISALALALWRGGAFTANRKRDLDATNTALSTAIKRFDEKLDVVKQDVEEVKHDIRNGGLKEAVGVMQTHCAEQMATVATRLDEHCKLAGHPGVTKDIANLKARVGKLEG